jgi:hypothetical protein
VSILREAVESHFLDLERHKAFHEIEWANEYKRAAFICKWLTKLKPISVDKDIITFDHEGKTPRFEEQVLDSAAVMRAVREVNSKTTGTDLLVNEYFALLAGLANLRKSPEQIAAAIDTGFLRNMLYELHFRNFESELLVTRFYLIDRLIEKSEATIRSA